MERTKRRDGRLVRREMKKVKGKEKEQFRRKKRKKTLTERRRGRERWCQKKVLEGRKKIMERKERIEKPIHAK